MKAINVSVGKCFRITVSGKPAIVQITRAFSAGDGWEALNLSTRRVIRLRSARRLKYEVADPVVANMA